MESIAQDGTAPGKLRPLFREGREPGRSRGRLRDDHQPEPGNQPRPGRPHDLAQPSPDTVSDHGGTDAAARNDPDAMSGFIVFLQDAEQHRFPMHRLPLGTDPRELGGPDEPGCLWKTNARFPATGARGRGVVGRWQLRAQACVWRAK